MTISRNRLAFAVMAATAGLAQANEPQEVSSTVLKQVTVTATRVEKALGETAHAIDVVDQYEIQQNQPESVAQAVKNLPNVTVTGGPRATAQGVNIRGVQGTRVLQVTDGARQNFNNGHRGTFFTDPELLKSIEVAKGPASSLWGSGAIGGVVVQNTKNASDFLEPGQTIGGYVSQGYHSNNSKSLTSGSIYGQDDSIDWLLNGYYNDGDDYKLGNDEDLENSAARQKGGMAKLGWQMDNDSRFEFKAQHTQQNAKVPSNPSTNVGRSSPLITQDTTSTDLSASYLFNPDSKLIDSKLQLFYTDTEFDEYRIETKQKDNTRYKTLGTAFTNQSNFSAFDLTYGFDAYQNAVETERDDSGAGNRPDGLDGESRTIGAYVHADIPLAETWKLQPSIRYDRFKSEDNRKDSDVKNKKQSKDAVSPSVALIWNTTDWLTLSAAYNEAFRAPGMEEMFSTGTHFGGGPFRNVFVPNPDLKPEEAKNKELSANMRFANLLGDDELQITGNIFRNDVDNFINQIVSMRPGNMTTTWVNVDEARLEGFELVAKYRFENIETGLSYGQTRGEDRKNDEDLDNIPADKTVADIAYLALQGDLKFGTRYTHANSQDKVSESSKVNNRVDQYDGYELWDLYASYEPATGSLKGFKADFTVNNVTDKHYRVAWSELYSPGRNYKLNVRYMF
ncbi:MAG: TonB-dependent hemoglobin/transferrin/lactoferrin family receptor [Endozoicomonas sp.]